VRLELPERDSRDPFTFSSVLLKGKIIRMARTYYFAVRLELPERDSRDPFTFSSVSLKGHLMRMTFCSEAGTARERDKTVAQDSRGPFTLSSISQHKLSGLMVLN
jgi:hypothetical protein